MRTRYESHNADFSNAAHEEAKHTLYPEIFRCKSLTFESTLLEQNARSAILDGEMGVDRIVHVSVRGLHAPLVFTVQERFRRIEYADRKDLTITEWNGASNLPSELYKINAGLFLYGYYDDAANYFVDAICIDTIKLLHSIVVGDIWYSRHLNKKQQEFLAFNFDVLQNAGAVLYRYVSGDW